MPNALLFTYRDIPGLAAAARALHLPEVLLDMPHWAFLKSSFEVAGGPSGHLPGVLAQHTDLAFALDRSLVLNHLLPTHWGALLRPDPTADFHHGTDDMATVAGVRAELEAAGYTVIDWASARGPAQPRRPPARSAAFLAAARAVAAAPDPSLVHVPDLPCKVDLNGPDDDEAIRVLARAGQLWRARWFWNTAFDGDPDDAFRVEALAREAGVSDHDWARFVALAPRGHSHPPLELWLLAHVADLHEWLARACADHPKDLPWIALKLRERLWSGDTPIKPLADLHKRCIDRLGNLAKRAGTPPDPDAHRDDDAPDHGDGDPSLAQRRLLLLLATPVKSAVRQHLAEALPSTHGGAMAGLIAVHRLLIDDPALPVHAPDLADGLALLDWPAPAGAGLRELQRTIRGRAHELDAALAAAARAHLPALQAGVFGPPRFDPTLPDAATRPRDVPTMLGQLLDGTLPVAERNPLDVLRVTSGRLTATDPLTSLERPPFTRDVPLGEHMAEVAIDDDGLVGALLVRFDQGHEPLTVPRWEAAVRVGEDPSRLEPGQIFGYPVDGGLAAIMDVDAAAALAAVEDYYDELIEPALGDDPAVVLDIPDTTANAAISRSGDGDGFYSAWWGLDERDRPLVLVADFGTLDVVASDDQRDAATLAALAPWIDRARAVLDDALGPHGFGPAEARLDRECDWVEVEACSGELKVQITAGFDDHGGGINPREVPTLRAFVADEESEAWLELDDLGPGPYAALAAIEAALLRDGDAFVAAIV